VKAGWKVKPLEDVASIVNGGTPKSGVSEYWGGEVQWLTPKDMGQMEGREIANTPRAITEKGLRESSARLVPPCSVILSTRAPIGHLAINTAPMAFNQGCRGIVPLDGLDHLFLYYFLLANRELLDSLGTGTTFKELSGGSLKAVPIPLPPLEEQYQIVVVLDEAFEGLARARAHAEANLRDATKICTEFVRNAFQKSNEGAVRCTVGDIITLQRGFDITKKDQGVGTVPVISSGGARSFHSVAVAKGPGVVVGRKGSIGSVHYTDEDYWPHDTTLWVKDFKGNNQRLVFHLLRGLKLQELDTGSANPSLNRNLVHPLEVYWPAQADQDALTARIEEFESATQELTTRYQSNLRDIDALRQSLLQRALSGELKR
jgi:type I restriction enzyme S subunit